MNKLEYSSDLDGALKYLYGSKNCRGTFENVYTRVKFLSKEAGGKLTLYLLGFGSCDLTVASDDVVRYDSTSSPADVLAIITFTGLGLLEISTYPRESNVHWFKTRSGVESKLEKVLDVSLDKTVPVFPNVTEEMMSDGLKLLNRFGAVHRSFIGLLLSSLSRPLTIEDLRGKIDVPLSKLKYETKNLSSLFTGVPSFVRSYVVRMYEAYVLESNELAKGKLASLHVCTADTLNLVTKYLPLIPGRYLRDYVQFRIYSAATEDMSYEARVTLVTSALANISDDLLEWFGVRYRFTRVLVRKHTTILRDEDIRSLLALVEEVIMSHGDDVGFSLDDIRHLGSDLTKARALFIYAYTKYHSHDHPTLVLMAYLLGFSIYGTSSFRVEEYPKSVRFESSFGTVEVRLHDLAVLMFQNSTPGKSNLLRIFARHYATLTWYLRKWNNIKTNPWGDTRIKRGEYLFDTANYVTTDYLNDEERQTLTELAVEMGFRRKGRNGNVYDIHL